MEKEKPRNTSSGQPEKRLNLYPLIVGAPAVGLIIAGVAGSDEKAVIAGVGLLGLEVGALLLIKRFEVKRRK